MKLLLIKTSSMGDVIHTLPALTDAMQQVPNLEVTWVVEESFSEIPSWHPAVKNIIPIALRRWRKSLLKYVLNGEIKQCISAIRAQQYDVIIDAQGLLKSAWIAKLAHGKSFGYAKGSSKEPVAWAYNCPQTIDRNQHAVKRLRELLAKSLGYPEPQSSPDYGIEAHFNPSGQKQSLMFVHGTTWPSKHWPQAYWLKLAQLLSQQGYCIKVPNSNAAELERAKKLAEVSSLVEILPKTSLTQLASIMASMQAVIAVDTGLSHLAAALNIPTITLYGPTDPAKIGTYGQHQVHLKTAFACCGKKICAKASNQVLNPPCYTELTPDLVYSNLQSLLQSANLP